MLHTFVFIFFLFLLLFSSAVFPLSFCLIPFAFSFFSYICFCNTFVCSFSLFVPPPHRPCPRPPPLPFVTLSLFFSSVSSFSVLSSIVSLVPLPPLSLSLSDSSIFSLAPLSKVRVNTLKKKEKKTNDYIFPKNSKPLPHLSFLCFFSFLPFETRGTGKEEAKAAKDAGELHREYLGHVLSLGEGVTAEGCHS